MIHFHHPVLSILEVKIRELLGTLIKQLRYVDDVRAIGSLILTHCIELTSPPNQEYYNRRDATFPLLDIKLHRMGEDRTLPSTGKRLIRMILSITSQPMMNVTKQASLLASYAPGGLVVKRSSWFKKNGTSRRLFGNLKTSLRPPTSASKLPTTILKDKEKLRNISSLAICLGCWPKNGTDHHSVQAGIKIGNLCRPKSWGTTHNSPIYTISFGVCTHLLWRKIQYRSLDASVEEHKCDLRVGCITTLLSCSRQITRSIGARPLLAKAGSRKMKDTEASFIAPTVLQHKLRLLHRLSNIGTAGHRSPLALTFTSLTR